MRHGNASGGIRLALLGTAAMGLALCVDSGSALAQGFYIPQQSISGLGRSFAAEAAMAQDASTVFFNPAGMTELKHREVVTGAQLLIPRTSFDDRGSQTTRFAPAPVTTPNGGSDGGNPFEPTPVPNLAAALPLFDNRLWLGFAGNAPFGLANDYGEEWFGRYDSTETELTTINASFVAAYRLTNWLSIGGGLDVQYADVTLENKIATFTATDADYRVEGDDLSFGFNVGLLIKPFQGTRIGIHYRSQINHDIEGEQTISDSPSPLVPNGTVDGTAELRLPDIVSVAIAQEITSALTVFAGVQWWNWSVFKEIDVEATTGFNAPASPQNYQDSWQIGVGAEYAWSEHLMLRTGVAFYTTPTKDEFRTTRTPDGDRLRIGIGATYAISDTFVVDAGYAHIFVDEARIDLQQNGIGATSTVVGEANGSVDIVSLALRYRF